MAGRLPIPTSLKLVRGTDAKHPTIPDDFQPTGEPQKPKWLRGLASKLWDERAPELVAAGVLKAIDADLFAMYCSLAAEFRRDKGVMVASRIAQLRALAAEFGIGAASRSRIHVPVGSKPPAPQAASKYFEK